MATNLLLIRHGDAVDAGPDASDGHRWLTARGRAETALAAARVAAHPVGAVVTSPLVRAVQTAEIVAAHAPPPGPVTVLPALATGDVPAIVRFAGRWSGHGALVLVGHEPTLSEVVVKLLGPARWAGFPKSAVVALAREADTWRFGWMFLAGSAATLDRLPE